jgi:recombination associated protein RdgC
MGGICRPGRDLGRAASFQSITERIYQNIVGLLSSALSITRYRVQGRLKAPVLETMARALKEYAIPEIDGGVADKTVGWTSFERPFAPDFEGSSFVMGTYFVLSLRIDKRTIPAKVLKKHCAIETAKRLAKSGRQFVSREEKNLIKDHVRNVLTQRIPTTPHLYDLIWSHEDGFLWFFSTQKSANEELESLFVKSFNLSLIRLFPYTSADLAMDLSDQQRDALLKLSATDFLE